MNYVTMLLIIMSRGTANCSSDCLGNNIDSLLQSDPDHRGIRSTFLRGSLRGKISRKQQIEGLKVLSRPAAGRAGNNYIHLLFKMNSV